MQACRQAGAHIHTHARTGQNNRQPHLLLQLAQLHLARLNICHSPPAAAPMSIHQPAPH